MDQRTSSWRVAALNKPKLRGVSHVIAFFVSIYTGWKLYNLAPIGAKLPVLLYAVIFSLVFGASGLLHFPNWSPSTRKFLRQVDHSMIFLFIAATYTLSSLIPESNSFLVWFGWIGAIIGILCKFLLFHKIEKAHKMVTAIPYAVMGWASILEVPNIAFYVSYLTINGILLMMFGGICYSLGALCYSMKKPNPFPKVFGYHEVLHLLVIVANYSFYLVVVILINSVVRLHSENLPV